LALALLSLINQSLVVELWLLLSYKQFQAHFSQDIDVGIGFGTRRTLARARFALLCFAFRLVV
jgi:hypothetical protein